MEVRIVKTLQEFDDAIHEMELKGLQIACLSNTGLSGDSMRATFLPAAAFKKEPQHDVTSKGSQFPDKELCSSVRESYNGYLAGRRPHKLPD